MAARCTARTYTGMYGARVLDRRREILAHRTTGRQVNDANIITMFDGDLQRLLTFTGADFQRFAPLITDEQVQVTQGGVA